ncbi:MAG: hypothetical protein GC164_09120 [Phycisphaera sp.]|nr:hypothetical protein [Phycisphaera sp.]
MPVLLLFLAAMGGVTRPVLAVLVNDSGSFVTYSNSIEALALASGSYDYDQPDPGELSAFHTLASNLWTASSPTDLQVLVAPADALGYDVVNFTDGQTTYFGLREQLTNNVQTKGWGSFFVRQGDSRLALVEVPHVIADGYTHDIGAKAFVQSEARGFIMAGAHRNANGSGTADVAHHTDSIFHEVHTAWSGAQSENTAWQVHGFDLANHQDFPVDCDAVLSNGTGGVSPEIVALDAAIQSLDNQGTWVGYAYNTLNVNDPLNVTVNGNVPGSTFGGPDGLAATTNVQKIYSVNLGGTFVHIELEQSFRLNGASNRQLAADAIASAIISTTPLTPVPEPASLVLLLGLILSIRRHRPRIGG